MAILDYSAGLNNAPSAIGNAMNTAGQMQGLMQNSMTLQNQRNQMQQQQQAQEAQRRAQEQMPARLKEAEDIMLSDDYNAQATFMLNNPDIQERFVNAMDFKDKGVAGKKSADMADRVAFNKDILSSSADPRAKIRQRIIDKKATGANTDNLEANLAFGTDEEIRSEIRKELNFLDPKGMQEYNKATESEGGMTEYQRAMVEGRKADREISRLKTVQTEAKTQLQSDKLQQEIDKLQAVKEKSAQEAVNKNVDLDFEYQSIQDEGRGVLDLLDKIESHEGLDSVIGFKGPSSLFGLKDDPIGGSPGASALTLIDNLEAKNFITAVGQFKAKGGAGSLSDSEGKKLASSLTSLSREQSLESFKESLNEVRRLVKLGMTRAKQKKTAKSGGVAPVNITKMSDEELFN